MITDKFLKVLNAGAQIIEILIRPLHLFNKQLECLVPDLAGTSAADTPLAADTGTRHLAAKHIQRNFRFLFVSKFCSAHIGHPQRTPKAALPAAPLNKPDGVTTPDVGYCSVQSPL